MYASKERLHVQLYNLYGLEIITIYLAFRLSACVLQNACEQNVQMKLSQSVCGINWSI